MNRIGEVNKGRQTQRRLLRHVRGIRRNAVATWGIAAAVALGAIWLRAALDNELPPGFPFLTFFPAVVVVTFVCGLYPGAATAIVCGIAAWYWFVAPFSSFSLSPQTALAMGFYAFIVGVYLLFYYFMQRALQELSVERRRSEKLAEEHSLLFHELQHRVSNNLAMVGSLLRLQQANVSDEAARIALAQAAARLIVVARIQRRLHDPNRQSSDGQAFFEGICTDILQGAGAESRISCSVDAKGMIVEGDQAVPIGLIVTELISNAIEHGFPGQANGTIELTMAESGGVHRITLVDDGLGMPGDFEPIQSRSLGMRIIHALTLQLGGELVYRKHGPNGGRGLTTVLTLPHADNRTADNVV